MEPHRDIEGLGVGGGGLELATGQKMLLTWPKAGSPLALPLYILRNVVGILGAPKLLPDGVVEKVLMALSMSPMKALGELVVRREAAGRKPRYRTSYTSEKRSKGFGAQDL